MGTPPHRSAYKPLGGLARHRISNKTFQGKHRKMPNSDDLHSGHRKRLREQFLASGARDLPESELLELLLTYAIPRRDVAPLARELLERFGHLPGILTASHDELLAVPGIGEQAAVLFQVVAQVAGETKDQEEPMGDAPQRPGLLETEQDLAPAVDSPPEPRGPVMRTFTNDLSAAALEYLRRIADFDDMDRFQDYLEQSLPYNSVTSRKRYARNLISRYYPTGEVDSPLTNFFRYQPDLETLKPVLFYETARAEPALQFVAEDVVWPAVPMGHLTRAQLRERLESVFTDVSPATIKRMLYSLFNVCTVLNQAHTDGEVLRFQVHRGTFEAFLYILTTEFPKPGMYRFEELEEGPMRRWLLWDREWMHKQLYNLRDLDILSKVSQIDTLRQFTLQHDQRTALRHYFEHPQRGKLALREGPAAGSDE